MLRKVIKSVMLDNKFIFYKLFVEASGNVHQTSNILAELINNTNKSHTEELTRTLKKQRKKAININTAIDDDIRNQFITLISRQDANELSTSMLQLTKRIIKIYKKIQVYKIDIKTDDYLILGVVSLQKITKSLNNIMLALRNNNHKLIQLEGKLADELDDNVVEELGYAMNQILNKGYSENIIIGLNDVYSELESAIDKTAILCDLATSVSIKTI